MLRSAPSPTPRQPSFNLDLFQPPIHPASPRLVFNPRRSLPAYSLLVGACEDGRPLMLDLLNPSTGPVLIVGDPGCGKTALMQSICRSAAELNGPAEVRPLVITSRPRQWLSLKPSPAYIVSAADRGAVERLLLELGALSEQRREGDLAGPAALLFIDALPDMLKLDFALQVQLHHLLGSGAAARIWSFAAVETRPALNLHYWINLFHTRLIGSVNSPASRRTLACHPGLGDTRNSPSPSFSYWDHSAWRSFWSAAPQSLPEES